MRKIIEYNWVCGPLSHFPLKTKGEHENYFFGWGSGHQVGCVIDFG